MIAIHDLVKHYGQFAAVDGVSCTFRPGELTAIVGPNGAGKTTYFNLISGQLTGTVSTRIEVGGLVSLAALEDEHIRRVIAASPSLEEAARILSIDPSTLYRKRKRTGS